jgi:hypothetical protein
MCGRRARIESISSQNCRRESGLGFGFRRRNGANHLSGRDLVALVDRQRRQPARIFCRDIDLRRFEAAVGFHDPLRHIDTTQTVYQRLYRCAGFFERALLLRLGVRPDD